MPDLSIDESFSKVKRSVEDAMSSHFPVKGQYRTLHAKRIWVEDNLSPDDLKDQKEARLRGRSWTVPVKAELELVDNATGKVVDAKVTTITQLPKMTKRYSYIVDGSEYQVQNQLRLKSGVYARVKENGELESQWNLQKGLGFRMNYEPDRRKFSMQFKTSNVPVYSVLKLLGVDEDTLEARLGKELVAANRIPEDRQNRELLKIYRTIRKAEPSSVEDMRRQLRDYFAATEIRPDSTKLTLGKEVRTVDGEALLLGLQKMLRVSRQEEDPDDRDSLVFKDVYGTEDLLHERVSKDYRKLIEKKLLYKVDQKKDIGSILDPTLFQKPVLRFFTTSALSERTPQHNPMVFLSSHRRTTIGGEHGLQNDTAITLDAQAVNPSHVGFIDPIQTPESARTGTVLQIALGTRKNGKSLESQMWDTKQKKFRWVEATEASTRNLAFPDQVTWSGGVPRPKDPTSVKVVNGKGRQTSVPWRDVDFVVRTAQEMFDISANSIPFLQSSQGNRTMVAAKQVEQAVSLTNREAPLVQVATPGGSTFENEAGRLSAHVSPVDGVVSEVTDDQIVIKGPRNTKTKVELYKDFPTNDNKGVLDSVPLVKVGDTVKAGQLLADTNFSKGGTLAIGTNLTVAYTPYDGYNFEDGIVVSESAAKKLTSEHMLRFSLSEGERVTINKKRFIAETAGQYSTSQIGKLDDRGVVKQGETLEPGDVIIAALRERPATTEQQMLIEVSRKGFKPITPYPQIWDKDYPGVVSRVERVGKETTVYVKAKRPAEIGDKVCFAPDHEVLTKRGWVLVEEITLDDLVASLNPDTDTIEYVRVAEMHRYEVDEALYVAETDELSMAVTQEHAIWAQPINTHAFGKYPARELLNRPYWLDASGNWAGVDRDVVELPGDPALKLPVDTYLMLLGLFLTRGYVSQIGGANVLIKGVLPNTEVVERLQEAGVEHTLYRGGANVSVADARIVAHFIELTSCQEPRLEPWILELPPARLRRFWGWLASARPSCEHNAKVSSYSRGLVDDYQTLLLHIGRFGIVSEKVGLGIHSVRARGSRERLEVPSAKQHTQKYTGKVYCPTLEKNHILYTRRDGKPHWSGNCGRYGNKGILTRVIPDIEMPIKKDGVPVDMLLNPAGVPSRMNLGQVLETAASKIAEKTGKPYVVTNFDPNVQDHTRKIQDELRQHGLSDTEDLYDPRTKKRIGSIMVGKQYIMKLHHTAEKGISARFRGSYDLNYAPKKGGGKSGQAMDVQGLYGLLAHGARENIREMQTTKSGLNDEFWVAVQAGEVPPAPNVPFVYKKFESYLRAMGIDVQKNGTKLVVGPQTDAQVRSMSSGEIKHPDKVLKHSSKSALIPEEGGLFDPKATGTTDLLRGLGTKWNHVELPFSVPNPVFEQPVISLLGLKKDQFDQIIRGDLQLGGKTGPDAIADALRKIDVKTEIQKLTAELPKVSKSDLNNVTKRLKYLRALEQRGIRPVDAYTQTALPVLPAVMRPITVMDDGSLNIDDTTSMYGQVGQAIAQLRNPLVRQLPEDDETVKELKAALYDGVKATTLTGTTLQKRYRRGIMGTISGSSDTGGGPKTGFFQEKVIRRRQDLSLRGVIVPEPSLSIDEVAIPRKAATEVYRPFIVRRLVQNGFTPGEAIKSINQNSAMAQRALELEVQNRPILLKRDPVLHKYGVQAFRPVLTEGKAVKIHPLVTSGFNADFDGDKMAAFVPVGEKAVTEAYKLLPSRNIVSPSNGRVMFVPSQESMLGLHQLTKVMGDSRRVYEKPADAVKDAMAGKLSLTESVTIKDPSQALTGESDPFSYGIRKLSTAPVKTTVGRLAVYQAFPEKLRDARILTDPNFSMDKKELTRRLEEVSRQLGKDEYARTVDRLKDIGNVYATGFSFGLEDFAVDPGVKRQRDALFAQAEALDKAIRSKSKSDKEADDEVAKVYLAATQKSDAIAREKLDASSNRMYAWVKSGARGNWGQFAQMTVAPGLVADSYGRPVPVPVKKAYSEGLDTSEYWATLHGARMGTIGRNKSTSEPGAMTKEMMMSSIDQLVTTDDCGTTKGLLCDITDPKALNRVLASSVKLGSKIIPAGEVVDPELIAEAKKTGVTQVSVRTPMKCEADEGLCAKCFGITESGQFLQKGDNIGVVATHALGEPLTQLAMNAFHGGGRVGEVGTSRQDKFDRVTQLTRFPKTLAGSAVLASVDGAVRKVEPDTISGGFNVWVENTRHYLPADRGKPLVAVGVRVKKGTALSAGPKNPLEMLPLTGISGVQQYLADELDGTYAGQSNLQRRNVEVVVRSLTNLVEVDDPGSHPTLLPGDRTSASSVNAFNSKLQPGEKPVVANPVLKGTNVLPNEISTDWMARLQFKELKSTLQDAAAEGWSSETHGVNPIPALAIGTEFGKGTAKEPWKY